MRLDKDKCLGGRLNNQTVTGIRLNGYTIFPIFELSNVYNTYELYYTKYPTGNYTASVVEKDCAIDYKLRTDWGDGTIDDESTHTYAEPGKYTIRSNGFLNMETDNGSRQLISTPYIRPDVIDGSYLFYNYKNSEVAGMNHPSFDGLSINTSFMNNMSYMFYNCIGIEDYFDLSGFNTSKVTDMSYMFYGCKNIYDIIGIEDWDTSRVTNMNHMFYNCDNILSLSLINWNTSRAIDMSYMFYSCNRIQYINLSNFDMTNVTSTENMFSGCVNLQTLRLDNCNENTVRKIIESNSLPTSDGFGERKMFINPNYVDVNNLTPPTTWVFVNKDTEEIIS